MRCFGKGLFILGRLSPVLSHFMTETIRKAINKDGACVSIPDAMLGVVKWLPHDREGRCGKMGPGDQVIAALE